MGIKLKRLQYAYGCKFFFSRATTYLKKNNSIKFIRQKKGSQYGYQTKEVSKFNFYSKIFLRSVANCLDFILNFFSSDIPDLYFLPKSSFDFLSNTTPNATLK